MFQLSHKVTTLPDVEISFLPIKSGQLAVVRDDLLEGGTKQRAAIPFLLNKVNQNKTEFIYASPFSGFAQIAIAVSCKAIQLKATIFVERDKTKSHLAFSPYTNFISNFSNIHLTESLEAAEQAATIYAQKSEHRFKIPLGLNDSNYKHYLRRTLLTQWEVLCDKLNFVPQSLWIPVGSGTLAETFRSVVPLSTKLICVDVGVLAGTDARIQRVKHLANTQYLKAPEQFAEAVQNSPPIPSNPFYDAKLWQFIVAQAGPHDVWWNVA